VDECDDTLLAATILVLHNGMGTCEIGRSVLDFRVYLQVCWTDLARTRKSLV
jgi:hypothetical protein